MAVPIYVPRINNNDDEVKLVGVHVEIGMRVSAGQVIAQIETDKAVIDLEATMEGFVLTMPGELESILNVGDVFVWVGETAEEAIPDPKATVSGAACVPRNPTAKARALLREYGLDAAEIPSTGERLGAADVQRHIQARNLSPVSRVSSAPAGPQEELPAVAGVLKSLKNEERGMLATVMWHRDVAVPGYIELPYDPSRWDAYSNAFSREHGLLLSPLLPLMAWRLVELGMETPRLNATISGMHRYEYEQVNLGFTVQAGETLYLIVVQNAGSLDEPSFVTRMVELQRSAAAHKLAPQALQGATIGFSSMARWKAGRHIPILPPHTALMIAHTIDSNGHGILGATYDHRVLNGGDVINVLRKLSGPGNSKEH